MFSRFEVLAAVAVAVLSLSGKTVGTEEQRDGTTTDWTESTTGPGLNVFGLSLHFNRNAGYNEVNPGIGFRYPFWRPAAQWEVFGDTSIYDDSRRHWAKYVALGGSYRFAQSWAVGAAVAYGQSETYHHGKPFFAPVPGLAFIHHGVAFNTVLLPSESSNAKIQGLGFFVTIPLGRHD